MAVGWIAETIDVDCAVAGLGVGDFLAGHQPQAMGNIARLVRKVCFSDH